MTKKQKTTEDRNQKTEEKLKGLSVSSDFALEERLEKLLDKEPELAAKLVEALETDRYFITISCQKKDKPDDQHDLKHYWMQRGYNKNDVVPSLKHLAADFIAKENPTADLPDKNGWH